MRRIWWNGLLVGAGAAIVLTTVTGLYAQTRGAGGGGTTVCLDIVMVVREYDRQKELTEEMRAIEQEMQGEAERRRGAIDSLQQTLSVMEPDDPTYAKRMRERLIMQLDYKNWGDLMQADMAREVGLWTRTMYREIMEVTAEIAQRQGYDLVLYKDAPDLEGYDPESLQAQIRSRKLLWASPTVDITQTVLDELNARYRAQPKTQMLKLSPTLQSTP